MSVHYKESTFFDLEDTDGRKSSLLLERRTGFIRVVGVLPHGTRFDPTTNHDTFQALADLAACHREGTIR